MVILVRMLLQACVVFILTVQSAQASQDDFERISLLNSRSSLTRPNTPATAQDEDEEIITCTPTRKKAFLKRVAIVAGPPMVLTTAITILSTLYDNQLVPSPISKTWTYPFETFFIPTTELMRPMSSLTSISAIDNITSSLGAWQRNYLIAAGTFIALPIIFEALGACSDHNYPDPAISPTRAQIIAKRVIKGGLLAVVGGLGGYYLYYNQEWLQSMFTYETAQVIKEYTVDGAIQLCKNTSQKIGIIASGYVAECSEETLKSHAVNGTSLPWAYSSHFLHYLTTSRGITLSLPVFIVIWNLLYWILVA